VFGTVTSTDGLPVVITLVPNPPREFEPTHDASVLDHRGETFKPALLLATIGQPVTIRIPEERTPHGLRITDRAGKVVSEVKTGGLSHRFTEEGLYTVSCELHRYSQGQIRVMAAAYAVMAASEGSFRIPNVAAGAYTITAHEGESWIRASVKAEPPTTEVNLDAH
jgi:plastocyanin